MLNMIIERLSDHPEVIPTLAAWYLSEWEPYYGQAGPGIAQADLEARCNRKALPIGLVAMQGQQVLGTAALDLDVTTNLTPSVVGLLVGQDHRGRGVATELMKACEDLARQLGIQRIYISASVLGELLDRLGWQEMGAVQFLNEEQGSVYARDL